MGLPVEPDATSGIEIVRILGKYISGKEKQTSQPTKTDTSNAVKSISMR